LERTVERTVSFRSEAFCRDVRVQRDIYTS
jgi:hypothetical protein